MADTTGTSYITTASEQANDLYNQNRDYNNQLTWQSLINGNDAAARQANSQLLNQYNQASAEAYTSALQSKQALQNSGIVGAYKNQTMEAYNTSLSSDMSDLRSSYSSGLSSIEESRSENEEYISSILSEQAQYSADYTNAHYDYLQYLYDDYLAGNNNLFDSTLYQKYLASDYLYDEEGNIKRDEETGEYLYDEDNKHLKSWDELSTTTTDDNGDYTSIYDENGNLTSFGIDFFDQMENSWDYVNNAEYGNASDTWSTWLRNNNTDLYDWASSYNYYNYTENGTNAGTVRTMYGMMSTDMTYSYLERMGGMTSSQVNEYFEKVNTALDKVLNVNGESRKDMKHYNEYGQALIDAMQFMVDDLNLSSSMAAEGFSWDDVKQTLQDAVNEAGNAKKASTLATGITNTVMGATSAVLATTDAVVTAAVLSATTGVMGATVSASVMAASLAGPIGIAILAVASIALGIYQIVTSKKNVKKARKQAAADMNSAFSQFAVSLTDYKNTINRNAMASANQIIH